MEDLADAVHGEPALLEVLWKRREVAAHGAPVRPDGVHVGGVWPPPREKRGTGGTCVYIIYIYIYI